LKRKSCLANTLSQPFQLATPAGTFGPLCPSSCRPGVTLPGCFASARKPALGRMIFCSLVILVSFLSRRAGALRTSAAPRPTRHLLCPGSSPVSGQGEFPAIFRSIVSGCNADQNGCSWPSMFVSRLVDDFIVSQANFTTASAKRCAANERSELKIVMRTQPRAIQFQPAALARCQLPR
jgi:hypothetical protein